MHHGSAQFSFRLFTLPAHSNTHTADSSALLALADTTGGEGSGGLGKQTEREYVGRGLTNYSRQVTFADVKRRNGKREKMGRVSVNSYWFTSENLLA